MTTTLFILFVSISFGSPVARDFILAGNPESPFRFEDHGVLRGFDIDVMTRVLQEMSITRYRFILERSSPRLEKNWKRTNYYDIVLTQSYVDERAVYLIYPKTPHITIAWNFFMLKERKNRYRFDSLADLKGLRIGATAGYSYTREFWNLGRQGVFKLDITTKNELQMKKLLARRFDLVPMNTIVALYQAKKGGYLDRIDYLQKPLKTTAYYNTFVKKSEYPGMDTLVKEYENILGRMIAKDTITAILEKYLDE
jgi:polar amino acid transport system substrate-binding protein